MPNPNDFALWMNALGSALIGSFWSILICLLLAGVIIRVARWSFKSKKKTNRPRKA